MLDGFLSGYKQFEGPKFFLARDSKSKLLLASEKLKCVNKATWDVWQRSTMSDGASCTDT